MKPGIHGRLAYYVKWILFGWAVVLVVPGLFLGLMYGAIWLADKTCVYVPQAILITAVLGLAAKVLKNV